MYSRVRCMTFSHNQNSETMKLDSDWRRRRTIFRIQSLQLILKNRIFEPKSNRKKQPKYPSMESHQHYWSLLFRIFLNKQENFTFLPDIRPPLSNTFLNLVPRFSLSPVSLSRSVETDRTESQEGGCPIFFRELFVTESHDRSPPVIQKIY